MKFLYFIIPTKQGVEGYYNCEAYKLYTYILDQHQHIYQ